MSAVRPLVAFAALGALAGAAFVLALTTGSERLALSTVWAARLLMVDSLSC